MATLRKRNGKWQVQVRRKGHPGITRTFIQKSDAQSWARQQELKADQTGSPIRRRAPRDLMVADILTRYRDEVVPRKRGAANEVCIINAFLRRPIAQVSVVDLTTGMANADYTERLRCVKVASANRELDILRHALAVARRDWDMPIFDNPFAMVARRKAANARDRRLSYGERQRLEEACQQCRNRYMLPLVQLALETGMRRGEILNARWNDLSEKSTLHIPTSKNGYGRTIPLSRGALVVLGRLKECRMEPDSGLIIPITRSAARMAWERIVKRAGLTGLRLHDLRHEAISRFFERGLNVPEVALISGHRDPRMLFRYTHPNPALIADKLQ